MPVTTIEWKDSRIRMIDQTRLPLELIYLDITEIPALCEAITSLRIRGAPALGVAAAFGMVLGSQHYPEENSDAFFANLRKTGDILKATRPTAVNLGWAVDKMQAAADAHKMASVSTVKEALLKEARRLYEADRDINRRLGEHGNVLIPDNAQVITHCNTGALATVDYGTAVGVLFTAHGAGKKLKVWVDETRPLLQGARLNMWELLQEGIDASLICDNAAAFVMQREKIDLCIVGADRIANNGDTANKIGTYGLAVSAHHHGIPFYIAAPMSTIDSSLNSGKEIPIEFRSGDEITFGFGRQTAPEGSSVFAPAFDVTPADLIAGIITEEGILRPPFDAAIRASVKS